MGHTVGFLGVTQKTFVTLYFWGVKHEALCLCLCLLSAVACYLETLASVQKKICCLWLLLGCGAHCGHIVDFLGVTQRNFVLWFFRDQIKFRNVKAITALPLEIGRLIRSCLKVASHGVVRSKSTREDNKRQ